MWKENSGPEMGVTIKFKLDGSLERYKACLVAKGFTQTYEIDYLEIFAPVAKLNSIKVLLTIVAYFDWPRQQLDVKNAFFNEKFEKVYMGHPLSFDGRHETRVCQLKKSLYRLKQFPRAWFERFTQFVKKQGYT